MRRAPLAPRWARLLLGAPLPTTGCVSLTPPPKNLEESQVLVGTRVWLPFIRARHDMRSRQALLDYSLTRLYRVAERHRS